MNICDYAGSKSGQFLVFAQKYDPLNQLAVTSTPCMSSGMWVVHPRNITVQFLQTLLERLDSVPYQWEQAAFNEVGIAKPC